jgi:anti-sigma B factor antagonist
LRDTSVPLRLPAAVAVENAPALAAPLHRLTSDGNRLRYRASVIRLYDFLLEFHRMSMSRSPQISQDQGVTVIALGPEYENLDEHVLEDLQRLLVETARNADPPWVVLDLSHTLFFGSAFLEIIFQAWNRLKSREGGQFAISGLTPYCAEILEVTHLDRLWRIYGTRDEAVNALRKQ